jgi:hypothetical protein
MEDPARQMREVLRDRDCRLAINPTEPIEVIHTQATRARV